jgi:hypothetical protein
MLMGIASQRYLLRMPDLVDVDTGHILRLITPALRAVPTPMSSRHPCLAVLVWVCLAHKLQGVVGVRPFGVICEPVHLLPDRIDSTA